MRYILCKEMGAFLCIVFYGKFGARKKIVSLGKKHYNKNYDDGERNKRFSKDSGGGYKVVFTLSIQFYS